ncbi:hypothetical protein [Antarctobacter jejuensis]|uniref:hypothetical protein n=1 Tax=Antarctobacter jejuensis TaxID=1439938 RepID=UPI003FD0C43F
MMPRAILLRQPHMVHLLDHPALEAMPDPELRALAAFMAFRVEHGIETPVRADICAYAGLTEAAAADLRTLQRAFLRFGAGPDLLRLCTEEAEHLAHRAGFAGVTKGRNRDYTRSVSVPFEDLPADWQTTLHRLRDEGIFAACILDRMTQRLGMFAWSAQQAAVPIDLASSEAQKALYQDMRARSAAKNDGSPRWSYLRTAWEEMRRFARAHGLPQSVYDALSVTYDVLTGLENGQSALKFAKIAGIGSSSDTLAQAMTLLEDARQLQRPDKRHEARNRAAAIGIGSLVTARPEDVVRNHVFGKGVYYDRERDAYRFAYTPSKLRGRHRDPLDIPLTREMNPFIDAVILQDQDPRYLGAIRDRAVETHRPLYVNYDGSPCAYGWYGRAWEAVVGTGGHIARTIIYNEFDGEFGLLYGAATNDQVSPSVIAKYRSSKAKQKNIARAQKTAAIRAACDGDISDLL